MVDALDILNGLESGQAPTKPEASAPPPWDDDAAAFDEGRAGTVEPPEPEAKPKPRTAWGVLEDRGIRQAAEAAGWRPHQLYKRVGFQYPIYDRKGKVYDNHTRWKNVQHDPADPEDPGKYRWWPSKPKTDEHLYYLLPDTLEAIANQRGYVILASGEPDVLAFRAAGMKNVLCWFDGEASIPPSLAADLKAFGVKVVMHYPDRDETGLAQAVGVRDALADSGIGYQCFELPAEMGSKYDINQAWIDAKFDSLSFLEILDCKMMNLPEPTVKPLPEAQQQAMEESFRPSQGATGDDNEGNEWFAEYVKEVKSIVESQPSQRQGKITRYRCINPAHADKHPSARISYDRNKDFGIYVCVCTSQNRTDADVNWSTVGEWAGLTWDAFKRRKIEQKRAEQLAKSTQPRQPQAATPAEATALPTERVLTKDPYIDPALLQEAWGFDYKAVPIEKILFSSDDAAQLYADRIRGVYVSHNRPSPFPFTAFHGLGGVFRVATPGDMFGTLGLSGFGKTSFMESCIDNRRQIGEHGLLISPEIPWWKTADRTSQRWGGNSVTDMLMHDLAVYEDAHDSEARFGKRLDPRQAEQSLSYVEWSASWPGKMYMIDQFGANAMYFLASIYKAWETLKNQHNIRLTWIALDYVQLMFAPREWFGRMGYEDILRYFKALLHDTGTVGHVNSQVRKSDTRSFVDEQKTMAQDAGMNLRDFQFKGFMTMTPGMKPDPMNPDKKVRADYTIFNVTKNSEGRPGEIEIETRWEKMLFLDHPAGEPRRNYLTEPRIEEKPKRRRRRKAEASYIDVEPAPLYKPDAPKAEPPPKQEKIGL